MDERELTRNEVHARGLPTREPIFPHDPITWFEQRTLEEDPHAPENTSQSSAPGARERADLFASPERCAEIEARQPEAESRGRAVLYFLGAHAKSGAQRKRRKDASRYGEVNVGILSKRWPDSL